MFFHRIIQQTQSSIKVNVERLALSSSSLSQHFLFMALKSRSTNVFLIRIRRDNGGGGKQTQFKKYQALHNSIVTITFLERQSTHQRRQNQGWQDLLFFL